MSIKDASGEWIFDTNKIKSNFISFYENLYTTKVVFPRLFTTSPLFSLKQNECDSLMHPLQESEILISLKSLKPVKSPGPDRLHLLFFQKIWT